MTETKRKCDGMDTSSSWPKPCSREATAEVEGQWYCGRHGVGARRRIANRQTLDQEWAEEKRNREQANERAKHFSSAFGTMVQTFSSNSYTKQYLGGCDPERFVVSREWLEQLLREREEQVS